MNAQPATELALHLAENGTVLLTPGSVGAAAERVVTLSLATLESCDEAVLCAKPGAGPGIASSDLAAELDAMQAELQEGPCFDELDGRAALYVPDLSEDARWPSFSPGAAELGVRSALVCALSVSGQRIGALQLYAHLPAAFKAYERAQGVIFATYAGTAISLAEDKQADQDRIDNLQQALSSREVIAQAQGILMERERITADHAFELLRKASQHLNVKLRAVAQELVDTGLSPPVNE